MDPFTQKLLARTQARKDQLVKKREELEACRAKRNSPIKDRTRRPLSEDNTDSGTCEINTDEIKRRRIGSDDSGKSSALRNPRDIDVNSPSVQARKERLMKMQQKDQENGVTPKKHWKPALTQGAKDANSPSVASRSAAFENNMRDEQQENAKDKRLAELQSSQTPGKLAQTRSVFENTPEQSKPSITEDKFCPPPKPPRVAAIAEANMEHCQAVDQQQSTKRKAPSPPKEKDASNGEIINDVKAVDGKTASVVKRRAPEPPTSPKNKDKIRKEASKSCDDTEYRQVEAKVKTTQSQSMSADKENEKSTADPVPAKRERKGSIDGLDNATKSNVDQPTPTPRRKAQTSADGITEAENHNGPVKKPKRAQSDATVTIVATPIVGDEKRSKRVKSKQRPEEESCIIQARVIEENPTEVAAVSCENTVTVKGISSDGTERKGVKTHRSDRTKVQVSVVDPAEKQPKRANEKFSDGIILAVAQKPQSSRKTRQSTKKNDFEFKVPKQPVAPARDNCHFDLNETVNLNDVNIHEITFNFDFGQFDQELEQDRGSMFVSYEEKCKQLEKERKREEKERKDSASASLNPKSSSGSSECDREERGSYKSGYNSSASDQYATKTVLKPKSAVPQRPKRTQDTIKMLLEEAAYQQNIVLQASQALNLCVANDITFRGSTEEIEAERVLLLASEHRTACLDEVQRLKNGCTDSIPEFAGGSEASGVSSCTANLSLSGIKIILRQDFMDVLRVGIRSDLGVFYFLCIIQHGPHEFYCTKVLSTNDATDGNFLLFPDKFTLKDIKPDFNVTIKVFCMNVKKAIVSAPVTPSKTKLFQSPKVVKGMFTGRRTSDTPPATQVLPSPQTVFRTSSFSLVGVTHVNLPIIKSKRFCLDKVPDSCPLSTYLEMKAECIPLCSSHVKGFLTILEDIGGYGAWQRRWCVLEGAVMSYWRYPGDESIKPPLGSIDLSECISEEVTRVARDLCARPNTMELKLKRACGTEVKYLLAADTKTDRATWIDSLNEALRDGRAWTMTEDRPLYPDLSRLHNQDVYMCSKDTE